jgi:hypothetical protein
MSRKYVDIIRFDIVNQQFILLVVGDESVLDISSHTPIFPTQLTHSEQIDYLFMETIVSKFTNHSH